MPLELGLPLVGADVLHGFLCCFHKRSSDSGVMDDGSSSSARSLFGKRGESEGKVNQKNGIIELFRLNMHSD